MNRATFIILAFVLAACGGAPFTLAEQADPFDSGGEADVRQENAPDAPSGTSDGGDVDASGSHEGGEMESSTIEDTGVNMDAMIVDSSPICTPVPTAEGQCSGHGLTVPDQLCAITGSGSNLTGTVESVPDACRCLETYTCACIVQMFPCGAGQTPSCSTSNNPPYNEFIVQGCN